MEIEVAELFLTKVIKLLLEKGILTGSLREYSLNCTQVTIVGLAIAVLKAFIQKLFKVKVTNEVASIVINVANEMGINLKLLKYLVRRAVEFLQGIYRRAQTAISYTNYGNYQRRRIR